MAGGKTNIGNLEISWINHATVKIKSSDFVLYIDPWSKVLSGNEEKADLILISHNHFDHLDPVAVEKLAKENTQIVCNKISAQKLGNFKIKILQEGEQFEFGGIKITGVPAYNKNKQFHPRGLSIGFLVEVENQRIYYAADTDVIPEMEKLTEIDVAFLPIGGTYTMNQEEAVEAAQLIDPKIVIPTHFNFVDKTKADPYKFKKELEEISGIRVILL